MSDRTPADAPWVDAGGQRLRCGDLVAYLNPDPAMRYFGRIRALIHDDGAPYVVLQGHPLVDGNDDVPCSMVALVDELALAELGFRVTPEPDSAADRTPNDEGDENEVRCPTTTSTSSGTAPTVTGLGMGASTATGAAISSSARSAASRWGTSGGAGSGSSDHRPDRTPADSGTLPDRLRQIADDLYGRTASTHSDACWQWHDTCALHRAAEQLDRLTVLGDQLADAVPVRAPNVASQPYRNGYQDCIQRTLPAVANTGQCPCGRPLDPTVFHDDDDQGRPLCVTCCPTCEHERHTQPCAQFAPAPGAAWAWCDHCGWRADHHPDDPPIGRAITRIVNPTTNTKETTP